MWFKPAEYQNSNHSVIATIATTATKTPENPNLSQKSQPVIFSIENCEQAESVAVVAKVARGLDTENRQKLLAYLAAIDETDPAMIDEYLTECGKDAAVLAWALQWADKILAEYQAPEPQGITCKSCSHFQSFNPHGGGAGTCAAGVMPLGACHWANTRHPCDQYLLKAEA